MPLRLRHFDVVPDEESLCHVMSIATRSSQDDGCSSRDCAVMSLQPLAARVGRYGLVGLAAAAIHATLLVLMAKLIPFWLSNLSGFLAASLVSYLGHALYTFRTETTGQRFARRWLLLQFSVNVSVSALLPLALSPWASLPITTVMLVFTPTLLNALIWSRAARFSMRRPQSTQK